MRYIGGKNQAGTYRRIINLIPPHSRYVEPFLGSGAILRMKAPAGASFGVDRVSPKPAVLQVLRGVPGFSFTEGCGISFLEGCPWFTPEWFVYCDPPYLLSTRGGRRYYRHEMTEADHVRLLAVIKRIPAKVMISGYRSSLYDRELVNWHRVEFKVWTRNHKRRTEVLWMNYPPPVELHGYQHVGDDWRDRWRIAKRVRRWKKRMEKIPAHERGALFSALVDVMGREAAARAISGAASSGAPALLAENGAAAGGIARSGDAGLADLRAKTGVAGSRGDRAPRQNRRGSRR